MSEPTADSLQRSLRQLLESLEQAGIRDLPRASGVLTAGPAVAEANAAAANSVAARPVSTAGDSPYQTAASGNMFAEKETVLGKKRKTESSLFGAADDGAEDVSTAETLEILAQEVTACTRCGELAASRTQTVFGVGNPAARLCFLGEAPGADEDRLGEPFVGRAGQLLNKILEACRLRREDVYILNILKCRPPGNRNPLPEEAKNCRRYLNRQLELIRPEFICCLGSVAAQNLLATTESIGRLRGAVHDYAGVKVVCTYHPAYLLRNPSAKKQTWDDMKLLMRAMGTPVD